MRDTVVASLVVLLCRPVRPTAILRTVRPVVIYAVYGTGSSFCGSVVSGGICPFTKFAEVIHPFVTDLDATPTVVFVPVGVWVVASLLHGNPDVIEPCLSLPVPYLH
jgi:hypothetical protein